MHTGQFLINFVNTAPLYNNMNTSSCSYWVTVHIFRTAGLSLVDLVTCLILSLNIAYKTKPNSSLKKEHAFCWSYKYHRPITVFTHWSLQMAYIETFFL
jgi:tRNA(Ile2) C34 agmatinyltransferase TiaS